MVGVEWAEAEGECVVSKGSELDPDKREAGAEEVGKEVMVESGSEVRSARKKRPTWNRRQRTNGGMITLADPVRPETTR